jgi:hypothetical protein
VQAPPEDDRLETLAISTPRSSPHMRVVPSGERLGLKLDGLLLWPAFSASLHRGLKPLFSASARLDAVYSQMAAWWVRGGTQFAWSPSNSAETLPLREITP